MEVLKDKSRFKERDNLLKNKMKSVIKFKKIEIYLGIFKDLPNDDL